MTIENSAAVPQTMPKIEVQYHDGSKEIIVNEDPYSRFDVSADAAYFIPYIDSANVEALLIDGEAIPFKK